MIVRWNNKEFKLLDSVEINKSSREVTYTDLKVDFSKNKIEDLPLYLQETQIIDKEGNLLFTGYVNDCKLPSLKSKKSIQKELTISLLSPKILTTKKTVTIVKTAKIKEIIDFIFANLYEEGFYIKESNISEKVVTVKFISKTIEECMNILSNKLSLYWNIDENKGITINYIEYQFNQYSKKNININNYKQEIKGLIEITPCVEGYDYANIINIKNARVFYNEGTNKHFQLNKGDKYEFVNPIDISLSTAERVAGKSIFIENAAMAITNINISYNDTNIAYIVSGFNTSGEIQPGLNVKNISTKDGDGALFVLEMDSMFKNLATGFTYKRRRHCNYK